MTCLLVNMRPVCVWGGGGVVGNSGMHIPLLMIAGIAMPVLIGMVHINGAWGGISHKNC